MIKFFVVFFFISIVQAKENYKRSDFNYESYLINIEKGFYTGKACKTNIDHVVSLKDAFLSGAYAWSTEMKKKFANDKTNHVAACIKINSSKGSATPKHFLRRSNDGKGLDYKIISFCKYLEVYYKTKITYKLSFENNDPNLFTKCNLKIY